MHTFSLASAVLLAVVGFAAAAPTTGSVQAITDIITAATNKIDSLSGGLPTPGAPQTGAVTSQISAIVTSTTQQVQAVAEGTNLTPSDLATLRPVLGDYATALGGSDMTDSLEDLLNELGLGPTELELEGLPSLPPF